MRFHQVTKWTLAAACASGFGTATAQQGYPNKPITMILPYAPGGATSALTYLLRQKLTEVWGQQMIVLHRPGGSASIGAAQAAKSPPDGYTITMVTATHIITPLLMQVPYDPIKDFAAITPVCTVELMLVVHPALPVKTLRDFIALAKSKPRQINYATSSAGSPSHVAAEMFSEKVGIRMQPIAYKGGSPAVTDVLGGQVEALFGNPINVAHHIKAGRLKGLAVSGERRLTTLPDVPTFGESGLKDFDVSFWQGVLAPAGTPRPIIDKLAVEIARIVALPEIRDKMSAIGVEPFVSSPDEFTARMKADVARYADVIKKRNIKIE